MNQISHVTIPVIASGLDPVSGPRGAFIKSCQAVWQAVRNSAQRLIWLKPPYRTLRSLVHRAYSTWNILNADEIRRVNVGCGKDVRPGWWGLDLTYFPGVNELRDATRPWRHRQLEAVFAEHFIEHLTLQQSIAFLTHAGKALRKGGVLRISTPNLSAAVRDYGLAGLTDEQRINHTIDINCCFHGYGHQFLYSAEFLRYLLRELGFQDIRQFDFGHSERPELQNLERHGPYSVIDGVPSLVIFEAVKGDRAIEPSARLNDRLDQHFIDGIYR